MFGRFLIPFTVLMLMGNPAFPISINTKIYWEDCVNAKGYEIWKGKIKKATVYFPAKSWIGILNLSKNKYAPSFIYVNSFNEFGKSEKVELKVYYDSKSEKIIVLQ